MKRFYPWLLAGFIASIATAQAIASLPDDPALGHFVGNFGTVVVVALFSFMGALIVIHQGGNRVGWLMMMAALAFTTPFSLLVSLLPSPPATLTPVIWLLLWLHNWFWLTGIIWIFLIVLNFPTGSPPSPRWNWINTVARATICLLILMPIFAKQIGPLNGAWSVENPLGFLPPLIPQGVELLFGIGLIVLASSSLASLYHRFKRGEYVEREQIKWLLSAGIIIIPAFGFLFAYYGSPQSTSDQVSWQQIFNLMAVSTLPLAIANAIFRYRLYEIDIIIRRTLIYGLLTALLAMVYFGGVTLLQNIFSRTVGDATSPLITVISTLGIAAMFSPLRRRVQSFIDRRFYRRKYDAEQILARFSAAARDEVDLERLTGVLLSTVEETMKPDHVTLWLRKSGTGGSH